MIASRPPAGEWAKRWRALVVAAAASTYLLVIFGAVVRASGSGLGCPDWPTCHGQIVPPARIDAVIEWTHRLVGLATSLLILAACRAIWLSHPAGPPRWVGLLVPGLLLAEVLLGAVVVWLELPGLAVLVHLTLALALLGLLVWLAVPGRPADGVAAHRKGLPRLLWLTGGSLGLLIVVGALVRATGAGWACAGFPACNDQGLFPLDQGPLADLQLLHRALAYLTAGLVFWLVVTTWRGTGRRDLRGAAVALSVATLTQGTIGAMLVSTALPAWLQALHVAGAAAAWSALVFLAALAARAREPVFHA